MRKKIEYVAVSQSWVKKLSKFYKDIVSNKDDEYFHPHPLTCEMAEKMCPTYASYEPVIYVLEVNAGWVERNEIQKGNFVVVENQQL